MKTIDTTGCNPLTTPCLNVISGGYLIPVAQGTAININTGQAISILYGEHQGESHYNFNGK